jgi:hypothetical protein
MRRNVADNIGGEREKFFISDCEARRSVRDADEEKKSRQVFSQQRNE